MVYLFQVRSPAASRVFIDLTERVDNLLVRINFIIVMIKWTGLEPWELEFPFPGSLTSTFLSVAMLPSRYKYVSFAVFGRKRGAGIAEWVFSQIRLTRNIEGRMLLKTKLQGPLPGTRMPPI